MASISYSDFQRKNGTQWYPTDISNCDTEPYLADWCDAYCLVCDIYWGDRHDYVSGGLNWNWTSNITLDRAMFESVNSLTFIWEYWPLFWGNTTAQGTAYEVYLEIGDTFFNDVLPSVNVSQFFATHEWDPASKVSHTISIPTVLDSLGPASISVPINIGFPKSDPYPHDLYYALKGISFRTQADAAAASPVLSPTPSSTSPSTSPSTVVIAGAVVGFVAFVALVFAAFLVYRRSKQAHLPTSEKVPDPPPYSIPLPLGGMSDLAQAEHPTTVAHTDSAVLPPPTIVPPKAAPNTLSSPGNTSTDRNKHSTPNASSSAGVIPREAPPVYGNSTVLATWASANRNAISEDMEAKLLAAGYMPGDNPDIFSEEEWQARYGITRLELFRLRKLYERAADV